ncbi:NADH-quinone oxidoreductase subunit L [Guyparkeria hydrothermalis]|uniref:NADH-quinone oxidoreductase subunit L n=1 Tax=Guyparkeria hydrothermalis TaxID=923 RepID=UPI0020205EA0|nr:NADH-quinone oxidoreductase subunit L [Guyparkeria hydrothermalis]MCL7743655.1 NADH-quinone oxidoreductase subunit L [Guyparkeria hydrothermalis]
MEKVYLAVVLAPLIASIIAGLFGRQIGRSGAHWVTIIGVAIALAASAYAFYMHVFGGLPTFDGAVYTWIASDMFTFEIGFLIDHLTVMMMLVVTAVSLMVHIYTIGYMHDDPGYQRFFSYISLFTFSMLMLVMSNNLLQLFFGWEAVGLVSYLLIGFWYKRESAIFANLKAFLVNRVGDFGFLLGIAAILMYADTLDYATFFERLPELADIKVEYWPGVEWSLVTVISILLFIGAMGKSAQVPLHVWLPDSMEGPTPISALIHAATMVTAGIFMVARFSPLFELSDAALSFILVIGAVTALSMGLLGIVQHDIKRVVAYSTLSQLGYMTVALGVSAYSPALFHLMTHAFFKALLFLAAGSVIIAMHHEQDIRKMGGLAKKMPITFITFLIGALALIGFPGTAGFYSKESIIYAVQASTLPGATFAYWAVFAGVFVTAFYTFRMFFLVFFGEPRMSQKEYDHVKETPKVVTVPLMLLAVPSLIVGFIVIEPMLYGTFFDDSLRVLATHGAMAAIEAKFNGAWAMFTHGWVTPVVWMALGGVALAAVMYLAMPKVLPPLFARVFAWPKRIMEQGYGFDGFNNAVIAGGSRLLGRGLWQVGDVRAIDGLVVNGSAAVVGYLARTWRLIQTGYLYHYAFVMILGLIGLLTWIVFVGA